MTAPARAYAAYRATGADLPFGDPARAHGVPFEGCYWRITQPDTGLVVVALGAVCAGPRGRWGLCTLAVHPGGFVRTTITRTAAAEPGGFGMRAEDVLRGDAAGVRAEIGADCRLEVAFHDPLRWPRRSFGALGAAHMVPLLGQYWQPAVLSARVTGHVRAGGGDLSLDGAVGYAEKNWGRSFPDHWWWGHAAAFGEDVSVAFAGGRVGLAVGEVAPTAVVLRLGARVVTLAPPLHRTRVALADGRWRLRTRGRGLAVDIDGHAAPATALALDVPVPAEERGEPRSRQHLAGHVALRVQRGARLVYSGESPLAGLERGRPGVNPASRGGPPR